MKTKYVALIIILVIVILCFGVAKAQTADMQVVISQIWAQVVQLQAQVYQQKNITQSIAPSVTPSATPNPIVWCYTFNANFDKGLQKSPEVTALKIAMEKEGLYTSFSNYLGDYDATLEKAVIAFQEKYASEILTPNNLKRGSGYVGIATRTKLNSLYGCKIKTTGGDQCLTDNDCKNLWQSCYEVCVTGINNHKKCQGTGVVLPGQSPLVFPNCN